jgi:lipoprotein-anchoring transpeptidase ErfK/SrfK
MKPQADPDTSKTQKIQSALVFLAFFAGLAYPATDLAAQPSPVSETKPSALPTRHIVVSIPDHKLALLEDGRMIKVYDVAVGATDSPSPSGEFQIAQRLENPGYYKPGVVIGPGAANPLGTRWMGLNVKGFGIHGTNRPGSVGKSASHGCIRLRNRDAEDLFARVQVGDRVSLIAERDEEVARIFGGSRPSANETQTLTASNAKSEPNQDAAGGDK